MQINRHLFASSTALALVFVSAAAHAQVSGEPAPPLAVNEPVEADNGARSDDIVVTGTSIRGLVKPVGASTVAVDREEVKAQGVTSTVDLLANIPQIRNFGGAPAGQASATQSFAIPALRNLPNTQPGDGTLFLWNGNRMVGGGFSTRPDPAAIPTSAIERVEVVLGGGSAIYGSDAIAGTINFVIRKTLDGAEVRGTYGFADKYSQFNISGAWGKVWDTGNILLTADFSGHSNILGSDRSYVSNDLRSRGGSDFRLNSCSVPNVVISGTTYAYPNWGTTANRCDPNDDQDIYPHERRWSVLGSFNQQITDNLEFGLDAFISRRTDQFLFQQTAATGTIFATGPRANPYFQTPIPGTVSETVNFTFGSVFGNSVVSDQDFTTWQVMPSLKWTMGGGWRAVATFNYGFGDGVVHQGDINPSYKLALDPGVGGAPLTTATAINPFNLSQSNPALLEQIRNWNKFTNRDHTAVQSKIVLDGPLFRMPAGEVKLAVGGERYWEDQYSNEAIGPYGAEDPALAGGFAYRDRTVYSAFAELVVPFFGPEYEIPGFHSLTFNISGRYDHYSDFGSTFNPKIAGTWSPFEGLSIRGSYSTAFVAPSLNSMAKPPSVVLSSTTSTALIPSGGGSNFPMATIQGGNPGLKPETAKTYDVGFDLTPGFLPGLKASLTYYHIDMRDVIAGPNTSQFLTTPAYAGYYLVPSGTPAQRLAQIAGFHGLGALPVEGGGSVDRLGIPQVVVDSRTANLGRSIVSGIDYAVSYRFETGFGTFLPAIAGTHGLRLDLSNPTGAPFVDQFQNGNPRDTFTASLGYAHGPVKARVSWDYLGGYPILGVTNQTYVESFQTVNLYASYELPKRGILAGTTISVNLDNIFDEEPSFINRATGTGQIGGVGQGSFIGRFFSVSVEKKF